MTYDKAFLKDVGKKATISPMRLYGDFGGSSARGRTNQISVFGEGYKNVGIAERRTQIRNSVLLAVECICFAKICTGAFHGGMMMNFSANGSYVELARPYRKGTILMVKISRALENRLPDISEEGFRSLFLAEVKWVKQIDDGPSARYGMGLRYC